MTQKEMILSHLQEYGKITSWEAIKEYGVTRLSQYIYLLRKEGLTIKADVVIKTNRFGKQIHFNEYRLEEQ